MNTYSLASYVDGNRSRKKCRMRREDLMKPDPLSNILLLSSIVIVAALVAVIVLALMNAASAFSTTSASATYSNRNETWRESSLCESCGLILTETTLSSTSARFP